ncbi:dolichyl-phosphate-mannose-protein mannosyltransferase [Solirubrobacter pauli]|uniref:Dolichyl-phosphate-mannose-protein mannosyltransferase n=1 Tax=Solirubrobacter pauli TaxID=166793 RepID=A0A660L1Z9_9ACTN|nr:phospholipid carrier-dependent glycosyltransferase [Solirubrobacter pauli]RKQ87957.1 dolichyl-phosphate-mannose-protein mannosyltransferase [Solirubrobacter pauli]
MSAVRRYAWPGALAGLFVVALILRLVGHKTGLPYVYNADENAHFVPRAIGMFGHGWNPDYFINPPAFTYVLHVLFALKWGTDPAEVGGAFAADPTDAFALARAASAFLGAVAVPLTAIAAARLFEDKRIGLIAGALLAVAFLPVHYSHFALNDAPTMAPLALALIGVAGIYRTGRTREYVLAGAGLGLAIATKYQAGIVVVTIVAAAFATPVVHNRLKGLAFAFAPMLLAFLIANPYALLDRHQFVEDLRKQTSTAAGSEGGGKLGLANSSGFVYYLKTFTWGFGWVPTLLALGGMGALIARHRRLALVLAPAPILLFLYFGNNSRFFARWMLPMYPILAMLAAYAIVTVATRFKPRVLIPALAALALLQPLVFSVHNDVVLAREDTRMVARQWMQQHIEIGTKIVMEPIAPDQWAQDAGRPLFGEPPFGTGSGNRWNKFATSRSCFFDGKLREGGGECPVVKLEDYERTLRPEIIRSYVDGEFCWLVSGSTQSGRAFADPEEAPWALDYYKALRDPKIATEVFHVSPYGDRGKVPFSFDYSFNYYPLAYDRPGPEITIYRLHGGKCA